MGRLHSHHTGGNCDRGTTRNNSLAEEDSAKTTRRVSPAPALYQSDRFSRRS